VCSQAAWRACPQSLGAGREEVCQPLCRARHDACSHAVRYDVHAPAAVLLEVL
jgi:hypothetical protein